MSSDNQKFVSPLEEPQRTVVDVTPGFYLTVQDADEAITVQDRDDAVDVVDGGALIIIQGTPVIWREGGYADDIDELNM